MSQVSEQLQQESVSTTQEPAAATAVAQDGGNTTATTNEQTQTTAEQPQLTERDLEQEIEIATRNRDFAKMNELGKKLFNVQPTSQEQTTDKPAAETVRPTPQTTQIEQPKTFKVRYKGREIEVPDENNMLGLPTTGHLKREYIIAQQKLRDIENDLTLTREEARKLQLKAQQEIAQLRAQLEEARRASMSASAPDTQHTVASQQQTAQSSMPQMPKRPQRPKLSTNDPAYYTDEDLKAIAEYEKARDKYEDDMAAYISALQNMTPKNVDLPEDVKHKLKQAEEIVQKLTEAERERQAKEAEDRYWREIEKFQSAHKEFATKKSIREINNEILEWMDRLAEHHGIKQPLTPKFVVDSSGNTVLSNEWIPYESQKTELVRRYINDDKDIIEKSYGVEPPDGYKEYFRLAELEQQLKELKEKNRLGQNATLEDAYLLYSRDSGLLDEATDSLVAQERAKAAEAMGQAMKQRLESAVSMEPTRGTAVLPNDLSPDEIRWWQDVSPVELARNPNLRKRYEEIYEKLKRANIITG